MLGHVTALDDTVGKVVEVYKRHGYWENTILIFSSDNGANTNKGGSNGGLSGHKARASEFLLILYSLKKVTQTQIATTFLPLTKMSL